MYRNKTAKQFEEIVVWPLAKEGLRRAIYLIDHHRMKEIPLAYRKELGILLSRKWVKREQKT